LFAPSDIEVAAELALGRFDGGIGFAGGYAVAFTEQLEVMDQRFHVVFMSSRLGGATLKFLTITGPGLALQPLQRTA
jgi:hypothetical protein